MENLPSTGNLIIFFIILIIVFFIFREILLWYYRINESIDLQKEANNHLKKISEQNAEILNHLKSKKED